MYVPNYVPEPIEVPGNVTELPYRGRLVFVRKVAVIHLATVAFVAIVAWKWVSPMSAELLGQVAVGWLLALSLVRLVWRGRPIEPVLTVALAGPFLLILGGLIRLGCDAGFPLWSAGVGAAFSVIYAMLCGRDFSFLGQFFLSLIASTALIAAISIGELLPRDQAAFALAWNLLYLTYLVYDSASLMARRRKGEEAAAAVDLYRDVFNIFGYLVRVLHHWRRHKIWTLPR